MKPDYEILEFKNSEEWRLWLEKHHADTDGIWIRFYKKISGVTALVYAEALDVALCYGWIDGQANKYDGITYLQKYTPRRARSIWSKRNIERVTRLTAAGLMTPAGQAEIDRAKADGRWQAAYDSPKNMVIPEDFLNLLKQNKKALAFFETLNKSNLYTISWKLQTAKKPETRLRRINVFIKNLEEGKKPS